MRRPSYISTRSHWRGCCSPSPFSFSDSGKSLTLLQLQSLFSVISSLVHSILRESLFSPFKTPKIKVGQKRTENSIQIPTGESRELAGCWFLCDTEPPPGGSHGTLLSQVTELALRYMNTDKKIWDQYLSSQNSSTMAGNNG